MAEKKTRKKYDVPQAKIEGKSFIWTTEDGDTLTIPMRIKMKVLRELNDVGLDAAGMVRMVEAVAPEELPLIDEMDANDFTEAFEAWREAYADRAGAGLGESSSSSA